MRLAARTVSGVPKRFPRAILLRLQAKPATALAIPDAVVGCLVH